VACVLLQGGQVVQIAGIGQLVEVENRLIGLGQPVEHKIGTDEKIQRRLLQKSFDSLDVGSLLAFRALRDFELDFLTFFEGLETVHVDCGEVREQILAAVIWSDEAKTFGIIEPLNSTCCHKKNFQIKTNHTSHKSKKLLAPSSACSLLINKYISTSQ
jgi:hypothetical protein